jgi:diguanylate cyclase (GGDEF)-like protein/putative nucleotidyltransferase with HDIG domain
MDSRRYEHLYDKHLSSIPNFLYRLVLVTFSSFPYAWFMVYRASVVIAKVYITAIVALALLMAMDGLTSWQSIELGRFTTYTAIAILASGLKLNLSCVTGVMSVNFLLILLGIIQLTFPQAVVLGFCAIVPQYFRQPRQRRDPFHFIFNILSVIAIIGTSYRLFYWQAWDPYTHPVVRCAIVACCYFFLNALSEGSLVSLREGKSLKQIWRACDLRSFMCHLAGAVIVGLFSQGSSIFGWQVGLLAIPCIYLISVASNWYVRRSATEKTHAEQMAELHLRTIEALALAIEAKDHTTHDHLRRVQVYAMEIGKELNLAAVELDALRAAAVLHDIGKLAVPEHIISKPGKLTPEEFEKMKIHPVVGAEILERVKFPYPVVPIVAAHHEKWDGTGYPNGLKGEQIPVGARILSAVDCFDALTTDRQYRRGIPLDEAMAVLVSESGKAFDPKVISVLNRRYTELELMAKGHHADKLSTEVTVERGAAPAAGFEAGGKRIDLLDSKPIDFLTAISAARQEAQILFEMAQELGNSLSLNETLSLMAVRMQKIIPYDGLAIYVKTDGKLDPAFVTGDDFRLFSSLQIPVGEGLSGWVAENKKPIVNGNPAVESGYLGDSSRFSGLQSALAVPLEGIDGVVGVLTLYHTQKDAFQRDHLRILLAISSKLALTIENNLKYRQVKDSATTDYLTGLPNARSLFVHLEGEVRWCMREKTSLALLACDLDGFKTVNDRFGHLEGNRILRQVAKALRSVCRPYDYVARMGGDEFVIILPGAADETDTMIKRFCAATSEIGWSICGEDILALSVGKVVLPQDGCEAEILLAEADMRMYKNKRKSKLDRERSTRSLSPSGGAVETMEGCDLASRPDLTLRLGARPGVVAPESTKPIVALVG